ncbi:MAG: aminotransferase class I/II-fold pyridoxal phosphate-dependent enzyme, partial [Chlorobi bacterium]|nr:aminotransferase class I/II-fold pyridoxal phosphate-dependent enzyme [Chlorobiota bacterium]
MINPEILQRDNIKNLKPYSTARDEYEGRVGVFLDANENSFGSPAGKNLNRYPDPRQKELKEKLAEIKEIETENIFIGNGSDEAIDLILRAFCEPGKDSVLIMPPTYGMYKVAAEINGVDVIEVPLNKRFDADAEEVLSAATDNTKAVFICSPNNPTGNLLSRKTILNILENFNGFVVLDEAYVDFAETKSFVNEINDRNNLIVLQTFSKAWGLANLRVGSAFADKR